MSERELDHKGYPVRACDVPVEGGMTAWPCRLPEGHEGPHEAIEVGRSVSQRKKWLKQHEEEMALQEIEQENRLEEWAPELHTQSESAYTGFGLEDIAKAVAMMLKEEPNPDSPQIPAHLLDGSRRKNGPTKQREGDQPLPKQHDGPFVADQLIERLTRSDGANPVVLLICQLLEDRKQVGIQRYGTPLQAFNGRDVVQDAVEEAIDLSTYLFQAVMEGKTELVDYFNQSARTLVSLVSYQHPELGETAEA